MGQEIEGVLGESRLVTAIGAITDFKLLNVGLFDTDINADVFLGWGFSRIINQYT